MLEACELANRWKPVPGADSLRLVKIGAKKAPRLVVTSGGFLVPPRVWGNVLSRAQLTAPVLVHPHVCGEKLGLFYKVKVLLAN